MAQRLNQPPHSAAMAGSGPCPFARINADLFDGIIPTRSGRESDGLVDDIGSSFPPARLWSLRRRTAGELVIGYIGWLFRILRPILPLA